MWLSLVEYSSGGRGVVGSNPAIPTEEIRYAIKCCMADFRLYICISIIFRQIDSTF